MGLAQYSSRRTNISLNSGIAAVPAAEWDALFDSAYPFTRHAFLKALEDTACVDRRNGWQPFHQLVHDAQGHLSAAAPLYLKTHSYGEFVFDFSWAQASAQLGADYYPKLVCAIPFTPTTGPRLGARDPASKLALTQTLVGLPEVVLASSFHALFVNSSDHNALSEQGCFERFDIQFHWHNAGYTDFESFLSKLTAEKRKKIHRERRRIAESGLRFEVRKGNELSEAEWADVYRLYSNTYEERGQAPYLRLDFFLSYGRTPSTPLRLILAYDDSTLVAMALTVQGGDTLYGRHWGAADRYHSLHFETCYYQGIDHCIREGLQHYDAGTQGEHKRSRGFDPVLTHSAHHIVDPRLSSAVKNYLRREGQIVKDHHQNLIKQSPYRKE